MPRSHERARGDAADAITTLVKYRRFEPHNSFTLLADNLKFISELHVRKCKLLQFQIRRLLMFFEPFEALVHLFQPRIHSSQAAIRLPLLLEHFG